MGPERSQPGRRAQRQEKDCFRGAAPLLPSDRGSGANGAAAGFFCRPPTGIGTFWEHAVVGSEDDPGGLVIVSAGTDFPVKPFHRCPAPSIGFDGSCVLFVDEDVIPARGAWLRPRPRTPLSAGWLFHGGRGRRGTTRANERSVVPRGDPGDSAQACSPGKLASTTTGELNGSRVSNFGSARWRVCRTLICSPAAVGKLFALSFNRLAAVDHERVTWFADDGAVGVAYYFTVARG